MRGSSNDSLFFLAFSSTSTTPRDSSMPSFFYWFSEMMWAVIGMW